MEEENPTIVFKELSIFDKKGIRISSLDIGTFSDGKIRLCCCTHAKEIFIYDVSHYEESKSVSEYGPVKLCPSLRGSGKYLECIRIFKDYVLVCGTYFLDVYVLNVCEGTFSRVRDDGGFSDDFGDIFQCFPLKGVCFEYGVIFVDKKGVFYYVRDFVGRPLNEAGNLLVYQDESIHRSYVCHQCRLKENQHFVVYGTGQPETVLVRVDLNEFVAHEHTPSLFLRKSGNLQKTTIRCLDSFVSNDDEEEYLLCAGYAHMIHILRLKDMTVSYQIPFSNKGFFAMHKMNDTFFLFGEWDGGCYSLDLNKRKLHKQLHIHSSFVYNFRLLKPGAGLHNNTQQHIMCSCSDDGSIRTFTVKGIQIQTQREQKENKQIKRDQQERIQFLADMDMDPQEKRQTKLIIKRTNKKEHWNIHKLFLQ